MQNPKSWKIIGAISIVGSIFLLAPLVYLIANGAPGIFAIKNLWGKSGQSFALLFLTLLFSFVLAYGNACYLVLCKRKKLQLLLLLLPLSFPTYIMAFNWAMLWDFIAELIPWISRSSIKSLLGLSLVCSFCLYPYILLPLYLFSKSQLNSIVAQSITNGRPLGKTFRKVIGPLSMVPASLGAALVGYELLNDYGAAKYYGVSTLTTQIFKSWFGKNDVAEALALAFILLVAVLLVKFIASLLRKNSMQDSHKSRLPDLSFPAPAYLRKGLKAFFIFTLLVSLILPVFGMLYGLYFDWEKQNWGQLWEASLNSFYLAFITSLLVICLVYLLSFSSSFLNFKAAKTLEKILAIGYSIPGAVIAVGVLGMGLYFLKSIAKSNPDLAVNLNNSLLFLLFGLAFKLYSVAYPNVEGAWQKFGIRQKLAIKSFYPFRTFNPITRIIHPQLQPFLLAGMLFIFIDALKELPLTLILRPFNFETLAVKAFNLVEDEFLYRSAPYSLIISLFCGLGILVFNRLQDLDKD